MWLPPPQRFPRPCQPPQTTQVGEKGLNRATLTPHRPKTHPWDTFRSVVSCSSVHGLRVSLVRKHPLLVTDDSFLSLTWVLGFQVAMERGCHVSIVTNPFA